MDAGRHPNHRPYDETSDLVLTAIIDINASTMEVIPGDPKYKVTLLVIKKFINLGTALTNLLSFLGQHHSHLLLPLLLALLGSTEHLHELLVLRPFLCSKSLCCFHNRRCLFVYGGKDTTFP